MTNQELHNRRSWTLYQKIDHAGGTIENFISVTGKVPYVGYSGGTDSTVLLDIVRRFINRDIKAVYCNTGNEIVSNPVR
jgi:3'-phosphoadenosine 5'-phosphosulfate sulfotransferase (PAPS reductase)/FAD synthetase